ncbi:MAG TPA: PQQ-binding-like beta-propeller repeat protein, partial [Gammaproteobacteria bacterium]|nr:PQQ-binding-like beta-propeller repeat protein [Gammaproteobacteria bacterium]
SGMSPRSANQAQPLVYDGVVYIVTGDNDAFAIDIESGEVLWKYTANIDPNVARPCCGWAARGLGMGDGKIFVGQLDAKLVALDQRTGKVAWSIQAEDPKPGFSITSAPLYYDGMVITGFAGGDLGTRGRVKAFNAKDGSLRWTFYTVPGPGEIGHETWPQDSDVWMYGGASVWQTPAIDPELGMIYFSTSNPGPVLNGNIRAGDNLFSVSIVAIDVRTGEYRWHFQQVHHDIWDYDSPNPIILFDAEYDGTLRKGLAQAAKTGWVYLLDRITGEPLLGIVDTPVMQEPQQHTSPTQPFPIGDAIVPQFLDMPLEGFELVNDGKIFTPFKDDKQVLWKPLAAVNWPPSSYDPETGIMYICATDSFWGAEGGDPDYPVEPGALYSGSIVARISSPRRGIFAALDVTTNRLVWRQQWTDTCYSGSINTAGGLVFVGRNDGRITALDKTDGKRLWEFQTDGGVNSTVSTFEHNGAQYVAVYAGGTSLAGSKRSDGVWLFSLNGTLQSLPRGSANAEGQFATGRPINVPQNRTADLAHGRELYMQTCIVCHGDDGKGGQHGGGAQLTTALTLQDIMNTVGNGRNDMPAFGRVYRPEELHDVATFILEELL